jgi:hypothetical protein
LGGPRGRRAAAPLGAGARKARVRSPSGLRGPKMRFVAARRQAILPPRRRNDRSDPGSSWNRAMKLPWLGWTVYGLAAIAVIGYILSGGLYVGSTLDYVRDADGKPSHSMVCHYLYLNGTRADSTWTDRSFCPPFHP